MTAPDLHALLHDHAAEVLDRGQAERVSAVRRRIGQARRRRAAGTVAAVALLVAAAGALVALPQRSDPLPADAPRSLAGRVVPRTTQVLGWTYRYVRGETGDGSLTLHLPRRHEDLVLRAASDTDRGRLEISAGEEGQTWVVPAGSFGPAYDLPHGRAVDVKVRLHGAGGPVGLAVYRRVEASAGYAVGGVTYPDKVEGRRLVASWLSGGGDLTHTLRVQGAPTVLRFQPYCAGRSGESLKVRLGDKTMLQTSDCADQDVVDAGRNAAAYLPVPSSELAITLQLVDGRGNPVADSRARIGLGLYAATAADLDLDIPQQREEAGHRWVLDRISRSQGAGQRVSSTVDVTQPVLVVFRSSGSGMMRLWANGKQVSPNAAGGMGAMVVSSVGRAADLVLTGRGDAHDLALGVYRLAD